MHGSGARGTRAPKCRGAGDDRTGWWSSQDDTLMTLWHAKTPAQRLHAGQVKPSRRICRRWCGDTRSPAVSHVFVIALELMVIASAYCL